MAHTPESGHATFLGNFATLIERCTILDYNPANPAISLSALQTAYTAAYNAMNALNTAKTNEVNAINARQATFKDLSTFCTALSSDFKSYSTSAKQASDVQGFIRKITGQRAKTPKNTTPTTTTTTATPTTPTTTPPATNIAQNASTPPASTTPPLTAKTISVSQRSFVNLASHFAGLIAYIYPDTSLGLPTIYATNNPDFAQNALETKRLALEAANIACQKASGLVTRARSTRNKLLYEDPDTSIYQLATRAKHQLRSQYKDDPTTLASFSSIAFNKP